MRVNMTTGKLGLARATPYFNSIGTISPSPRLRVSASGRRVS